MLPLTLPQRVWEGSFLSRPAIIKQRFSKKYRHPQLDLKLTATRLKSVRWGQGRARHSMAAGRPWAMLGRLLVACSYPQLPDGCTVAALCVQEVRSMLKARKLGVHTPGARCCRQACL